MENELEEPALKYNYISPGEYLAMERASDVKHEYYDGQVYAMAGASENHTLISSNIVGKISAFPDKKDCRVLFSDVRVSEEHQDAYMYPDALIVCGERKYEENKFDTLLNTSVIFEILSPSTRSIDKGRKFFFYKEIPSLQEYIMIDSQKKIIRLARKKADGGWHLEDIKDSKASLYIRTIDFHLSFDEIYRDTGL